jgi:hypothetical protein
VLAACSYTLASFATSGLETMFGATLVLAALDRAEARRPFAAGLLGIAAAMAHPDHAIFYVALAGALLTVRDRRRDLLPYALPFLTVYLPYFVWRWRYYGELVPNTFYAKSADQTYFVQGARYLVVTLVGGSIFGVVPLAVAGVIRRWSTVTARFGAVGVPLYLVYVAKVGGDFMLGRLMTPALACLFLLADVGLRDLLARQRWWIAAALMIPTCLAAIGTRVVQPWEKWWHIADERSFYELDSFSPVKVKSLYFDQGRALRRDLLDKGLRPTLGISCVGFIGYYSRLPLFDRFGLTSRSVAHMPIADRGRPGHEKVGAPGHSLQAGVAINDAALYPDPFAELTKIEFGGYPFFLASYDPALMKPLAGVVPFQDYGSHLDQFSRRPPGEQPDEVACQLWFDDVYYFSRNNDPERREAILRRVVAADSLLKGTEALLLTGKTPDKLGYQLVRQFGFEVSEGWSASGGAFAAFPMTTTTVGQQEIHGQTGSFVNTFTPAELDAAQGTLKSPTFELTGDVITLLVGGGRDLARARVSLVVDGQPVRSATGCMSELLGQRVWNVSAFRGQKAHIEVVDETTLGWGHILVDEISEWRAPKPTP